MKDRIIYWEESGGNMPLFAMGQIVDTILRDGDTHYLVVKTDDSIGIIDPEKIRKLSWDTVEYSAAKKRNGL